MLVSERNDPLHPTQFVAIVPHESFVYVPGFLMCSKHDVLIDRPQTGPSPGSLYAMHGPARWEYQHRVVPVTQDRWSLTFRQVSVTPAPATANV